MTVELSELFSVAGRRVVVTGGSRGIGLMLARGFVQAGADVVISSRKPEACEAAVSELSKVGACSAVPADLGTDEGVDVLATAIAARWDGVDVLINNAGAAWGAPLDDYPVEAFDKLWAINVRGVFALTQALLPQLRRSASEERPSRLVNVGSVDGLRVPFFDNYAYSASKAGLHMLTRHLAADLASDRITVNAIAPGPFYSKMMASVLDDETSGTEIRDRIPLGRLGEQQDIVGLAIYLASRAGSWTTGTVIPLDGGLSVRS